MASPRGGSMLELYPGEGSINGIVYSGLTETELAAVDGSETGLEAVELPPDRITAYAVADTAITGPVTAYLPASDGPPDPSTVPAPNTVYHRKIELAIAELLGELYGDGFADRFHAEFLTTTHTPQDDGWQPMA